MNDLREFINQARAEPRKVRARPRREWGEAEMSTALDLRHTAIEAAQIIGCHPLTVRRERRQWAFE